MKKFLINIIDKLTEGLIKMSLLLDKQQEINTEFVGYAGNLKTKILALLAQIATLEAEIVTLNETLANIGTPEQLEQIIQPAKDALIEAQNL